MAQRMRIDVSFCESLVLAVFTENAECPTFYAKSNANLHVTQDRDREVLAELLVWYMWIRGRNQKKQVGRIDGAAWQDERPEIRLHSLQFRKPVLDKPSSKRNWQVRNLHR